MRLPRGETHSADAHVVVRRMLARIRARLLREVGIDSRGAQSWTARRIGVSPRTMRRWIAGDSIPSNEHLDTIAALACGELQLRKS